MVKKDWIYDIEVFPNLFLLCAIDIHRKDYRYFLICKQQNDKEKLFTWMRDEVNSLIGFNNLGYDYPIVHYLITKYFKLKGSQLCNKLYLESKKIINSGFDAGSRNTIPVNKHLRKQIDLLKINHFDNKAKMVGLKVLEFNMRMDNIIDLPHDPNTDVPDEKVQEVVRYCFNDCEGTYEVYLKTLPEIELRTKLSNIYNQDFTNFNSTKIGETILINKIIETQGISSVYDVFETDRGTRKTIKNTRREYINLQEVIFDYVRFKSDNFNSLLNWFKKQTITETKGFFSEIPFEQLTELEPHYKVKVKNRKQESLNVVYRDFQYVFGLGGIHGSIDAGVYESDEEYVLRDVDVASYYPNLAIVNRFYPEHLGEEFCDTYEGIYIERGNYPKKTHPAENLVLKLALNGSYGKSNSQYSALCDPQYTMKTTINGQLLLCMLSEKVLDNIPSLQMIQINTDGMTVRIKRSDLPLFEKICKLWERITKLELEHVDYSKMIIKDVNNYIAVKAEGGSVKRKGAAFIYKEEPGELELYKNFSNLVVPKALEAYFIHGTKPEDFIIKHENVYDFFKRTKLDKSSRLVCRTVDKYGDEVNFYEEQRVSRYFISGTQEVNKSKKVRELEQTGSGYSLIKVMKPLHNAIEKAQKRIDNSKKPLSEEQIVAILNKAQSDRETNLEVGYKCTVINHLAKGDLEKVKNSIHYQYYIDEAYKVINVIENGEN